MSAKDDGNDQAVACLTVRDYFAAVALPLVAKKWDEWHKNNPDEDGDDWTTSESTHSCVAQDAYFMADEMLKARAK